MSPERLALLPLLVPIALLAAGLVARLPVGIGATLAVVRATTLSTLLLAVFSAIALWFVGPAGSGLIGLGEFGLSIRLDALSVILLLLVSFVAVVVTEFSRNYLDGDARQAQFTSRLCLTLAAVSLLVVSGNLIQLVFAWVATSLALHGLLLFHPERPGAVAAARKKFVVARLGDGFLLLAAILLAVSFHTTDIASILALAAQARDAGAVPALVPFAAVAIAFAAMLKSAQFPTHGWLLEVMETPTPVSALLHAGIVNAGGFLVLRFADVMLAAPFALGLLAVVGGLTALVAAAVMLTQTSVKVTLAWSTVAQMGFMLLQCGLGAFSAAALHLVAHSLYKAHAFLSSGEAVAAASRPAVTASTGALQAVLRGTSLVVLLVGYGFLVDVLSPMPTAVVALGALFVIGLWAPVASVRRVRDVLVVAPLLAGLGALWVVMHTGAAQLLAGTLPMPGEPGVFGSTLMIGLVIAAAVLAFAQTSLLRHPRLRTLRVHLAAGLYANLLFDRLVGAHRLVAHRL